MCVAHDMRVACDLFLPTSHRRSSSHSMRRVSQAIHTTQAATACHMSHIQQCITRHSSHATHPTMRHMSHTSTACHMPHILTCGPKLAAMAAATAALSTRGVSLQVRGVEARHTGQRSTLRVTRHTSRVTRHTSHVMRHAPAYVEHLPLGVSHIRHNDASVPAPLHHQKQNQKPVLTLGVKPLTLQPNPTRELDPTPLCLTPCTTQYPQPCAGVNQNVVVKIRVALVEFLEHGGE